MSDNRSRNWCWTDYEFLNWEEIFNKWDNIRYIGYGDEICPTTGKPHFQGWMQFKKAVRFPWIKKNICPKLHLEKCYGTEEHNQIYCSKINFKSFGEFVTQGKRTDLKAITEALVNNATNLTEIMVEHPELYCRYRNGVRDIAALAIKKSIPDFRELTVTYIWGPTRTGKTWWAIHQFADEPWYKIQGCHLRWWQDYNLEKNLLIDEYDNNIKCEEMLAYLDVYKLRLDVKGSHTYANWTNVIITSNIPPQELHTNAKDCHRAAFLARINKFLFLGERGGEIWDKTELVEKYWKNLSRS